MTQIVKQRNRITPEQKEQLEIQFVVYVNKIFNINSNSFKEAYEYYQQLSLGEKRKVNWKELDKLIGRPSYPTKSFSYKFVNEVLSHQVKDMWPKEYKQQAQKYVYQLLERKRQDMLECQNDNDIIALRKEIINETLSTLGEESLTKYPKKTMFDMLRNIVTIEITKVIRQNQNLIEILQLVVNNLQ
ncbi:Hypothetical_protein [Hexamita inflata]|uniref:Hypothetical_protein n=1 Tax=Hexamita inflata TaxID=28002 RepID=A0AA86N8P0_9EUKA|nr:Hypothetical protein HINF_LOCUS2694 [Hexamita inflata]